MKAYLWAVLLVGALITAGAQSPSGLDHALNEAPPGPEFSGYLSQLFADNPAFTAVLDYHSYGATSGNVVTVQGKLAYLNGNTRFETDLASAGDANLPLQDAASLTLLGMNTLIAISRPAEKVNYFIYPGMAAYVRRSTPAVAHYSLEVTQIGDENVQGQNCVKNKVVATGPDGVPHASTVWNATDLNNFPIKIKTVQKGSTVILLFRDLKLEAPDAGQFNPPAAYKQYDNFMSLMTNRAGTQTAR